MDWVFRGITPVMLASFIYWWATDEASEEAVMFDTPGQKTMTVKHVETAGDAVKYRERQIIDSVKHDEERRLLREVLKRVEHIDSVRELDHDQIYQLKEQLKQQHNIETP